MVKVGHRQVVSLIRQGGSRLVMKVVSVTRKPDTGDVVRKKGTVTDTYYYILNLYSPLFAKSSLV